MVETTAAAWLGCTATMVAAEWYHRRQLHSISHRILVSGMRGKSTAVRLLHESFRWVGLKTMSRITGDEVIQLLPDGSEKSTQRFGSPNIREMRSFARKAAQNGCDVLCLENMAIQPEYVRLAATHILHPTLIFHCVDGIDHTESYPEDPVARARMIVDTWPEKIPVLIVNSKRNETLIRIAKDSDRKIIVPEPLNSPQLKPFMSDLTGAVGEAIRTCTGEQVDHETLNESASLKQHINIYHLDQRPVIDLRSANDPESTTALIETLKTEKQFGNFQLVYMHRSDRPGRLQTFEGLLNNYPSVIAGDIVPWSYQRKSKVPVVRDICQVFKKYQAPLILTGNRHSSSESLIDEYFSGATIKKW